MHQISCFSQQNEAQRVPSWLCFSLSAASGWLHHTTALQAQLQSSKPTPPPVFGISVPSPPACLGHTQVYLYKGIFYFYLTLNKPHTFLRGWRSPIKKEQTWIGFASQQENAAEQARPSFPIPIKTRQTWAVRRFPSAGGLWVTTSRCLGALGLGNTSQKFILSFFCGLQCERRELQGSSGQIKPKSALP